MRVTGHAAAIALLALAATGCWRTDETLTTAHSEGGEVGWGIGSSTLHMFAVLAYSATTVIGTTTAGYSPDALPSNVESYWQVHDGGRAIRYCTLRGQQPSCTEVAEPLGTMGGFYFLGHPVNLVPTEVLESSDGPGADATEQGQDGDFEVLHVPVTPMRGVWVRNTDLGKISYCSIRGGPACRPVSLPNGGRAEAFAIVGVMVLSDPTPTDVLWFQTRHDIYRCTATQAQPDPVCVQAQLVGRRAAR